MFKVYSKDDMGKAPMLELPTTAGEEYKYGEALVLTSGKLTKCGATTKPTYICMKDYIAPEANNESIPVIRVNDNIVFKVTNVNELTGVEIGTKVTLNSDGLQITSTTTDGVAEIVSKDGDAIGSEVLIRF